MTGKKIRLNRLFNGNVERENIIISAIDHGMFQGAQPGLEKPEKILAASQAADAILLGPGMIEHYPKYFFKSKPTLITRLAFTSAYCFPWEYHDGYTRDMFTPAYLQSLGADVIVSSLQLHTGSQKIDAENVEVWSKIVMEKERLGIPLMGEFHPAVYENVDKDEWHDLIWRGCRILAELGADLIKTFFTDDRFGEITDSVPVPIVILGSKKLPKEIDALKLAEQAVSCGARGVAIGRNIFQAEDPKKMIEALRKVVKRGMTAEQAASALVR
jgi:DhnA family fructose-bisphosphate aldolase class Ia